MITRTSRGTKRFAAAATVALVGSTLALTGTAFAGPGAAAPAAERFSGADRYETAAAVSAELEIDAAGDNAVIIVNGLNFPDGLTATGLVNGVGPVEHVLLTEAAALPAATATQLAALDDEVGDGSGTDGISAIVIVGGEAVVSSDVLEDLSALAPTTRVAGANRYETAIAVAGVAGGGTSAIIATGQNFPDALAAGPLASVTDAPLLLNDGESLRDDVRAYLVDEGVTDVTIVGGPSAVPAAVETELTGALGITVTRLNGANRDETAVLVAEALIADTAAFANGVTAVNGLGFADALAAGPLAVVNEDPILTVREASIPAATAEYHVDNCSLIANISAIGGTSVISDDVVTGAVGAATCEAPALESATIAQADLEQRVALVGEVGATGVERDATAPTLTAVEGTDADGSGANAWDISFVADADPAEQGAVVDADAKTIVYTDNFASLTRAAFVTNFNASDAGALFEAAAGTGVTAFDAAPETILPDTAAIGGESLGSVDLTVTITFDGNVDDGAGGTITGADIFANQNPGDATVVIGAGDISTLTPNPIPAEGTSVYVQTYTDYEGELPSEFAQVRYAIGDVHDADTGFDNQAVLAVNLVAS